MHRLMKTLVKLSLSDLRDAISGHCGFCSTLSVLAASEYAVAPSGPPILNTRIGVHDRRHMPQQ